MKNIVLSVFEKNTNISTFLSFNKGRFLFSFFILFMLHAGGLKAQADNDPTTIDYTILYDEALITPYECCPNGEVIIELGFSITNALNYHNGPITDYWIGLPVIPGATPVGSNINYDTGLASYYIVVNFTNQSTVYTDIHYIFSGTPVGIHSFPLSLLYEAPGIQTNFAPTNISSIVSINVTNDNCTNCIPSRHYDYETSESTLSAFLNANGLSQTLVQNQEISIIDDMVWDVPNIIFLGCTFIVGGNKRIVIPSNIDINASNCIFIGCSYLWKGIDIEPQGRLKISNSLMADAKYAINLQHDAILNSEGNRFLHNFIGINYDDPNGNTVTIENIKRNIFKDFTSWSLLPDLENAPCSNIGTPKTSYAGIRLKGLSYFNMPSYYTNGVSNKFEDMAHGIIAIDCGHVNVEQCYFANITHTPQYTTDYYSSACASNPYNGAGIVAINTDLTQQGIGDALTLFYKCNFGIFGEASNLNVSNNNMLEMNIGVYSRLCSHGEVISIKNNTIHTRKTAGIYLWQTDGASSIDVTENIISVADNDNPGNISFSNAKYGIVIRDMNDGAPNARVHCNSIDVENGWTGIEVMNGVKYSIVENGIMLHNADFNLQGVALYGNNGTVLRANTVNTDYSPNAINYNMAYTPVGIQVDNCMLGDYTYNSTNNTYTGMLFRGGATSTNLKYNVFGSHHWGLNFTGSLIMNDQVDKANRWLGSYGNAAARHEGVPYISPVFGTSLQGRFITTNTNIYFPTTIQVTNSAATSSMWFSSSPVSPTIPNITTVCSERQGGELKRLSLLEDNIASDNIYTAEYPEEMRWLAKEKLYEWLKDSANVLAPDSLLLAFKDSIEQSISAQFYDIKKANQIVQEPNAVLMAELEQLKADRANLFNQLKVLEVQIINADSSGRIALYATQADLNANIGLVQMAYDNLSRTIELAAQQNADSIKLVNAGVVASEIYELNQKAVNDIYYSTVAKGYAEFRASQINLLHDIAWQCPLSGGPAVYQARSLYAIAVDTFYDDKTLCNQTGIIYRPANTSVGTVSNFKVFPNPASTDLNIMADNIIAEDTEIQLVNALGELVFSTFISKGTIQKNISLDNIPNGLYICHIGKANAYKVLVLKP